MGIDCDSWYTATLIPEKPAESTLTNRRSARPDTDLVFRAAFNTPDLDSSPFPRYNSVVEFDR